MNKHTHTQKKPKNQIVNVKPGSKHEDNSSNPHFTVDDFEPLTIRYLRPLLQLNDKNVVYKLIFPLKPIVIQWELIF